MLPACLKTSKEDEEDIDSTLMRGSLLNVMRLQDTGAHGDSLYRLWLIRPALKLSKSGYLIWKDTDTVLHANMHVLPHGRGTAVPALKTTRMNVLPEKLDHFFTFITSPYVVQDLPFGEKTLQLSSNSEIKVPNVLKTLIPVRSWSWHHVWSMRVVAWCSPWSRVRFRGGSIHERGKR